MRLSYSIYVWCMNSRHGQKTKRLCKTVPRPRRMGKSTPKPISASGYIQKGLFPKKLTASKEEGQE